ncbi:polysaccharide deacetylase family protein [Ensifer sp. T173]|uniref:Chitooligosaccharide deacetylase n=1 Tax=Ensifer canadensis TaxID=555315 RepID=A0AAW4FFD6_9HYPH|nr:polysaccharide deacetylase family protein [Ensifer canadensis]MBM3090843.1 polysaccharide deacetylase family protein [Ensifer canadensis]UBI76087.1 polysaccharide deacetylase family protein [Ensifer canadensis]
MAGGITASIRTRARRAAIAGGLELAHGLSRAGLMPDARRRGAIFTLHHVRPRVARAFDPNAHLEITPEFLDRAITRLKRDGYRFIALDDLPTALADEGAAPFACFTLDDGYRNNLDHAQPVFTRHGVPFTVFVTGGFVDRTHTLWWETLADLLSATTQFRFDFGSGVEVLKAESSADKHAIFGRMAAYIHSREEIVSVAELDAAALEHGIDALAITKTLTLDEAGLRLLIENPLASLGAHAISHRAVARLGDEQASQEIEASAARVEAIVGQRPRSFAYPYGDRPAVSPRDQRLAADLGFTVAVTTMPGTVAAATPLDALPRISLNGHFQRARYVSALASGIPFRLGRS